MFGSGVQIFCMAVITMVFSVLGFLSPANQGSIVTAVIILFVWMGMPAGYASSRLYQVFEGERTLRNTLLTALAFPGMLCFVVFFLNFFLSAKGSSGALSHLNLAIVFGAWFFISVPLCWFGSRIAYSFAPIELPGSVNLIHGRIPAQKWYLHPVVCVLASGILPFGACFIEVFFIFSSLWLGRYYFLFGFLFLAFLLLVITCIEVSLVMCYFQLANLDWKWWWRSFLNSGAAAFYVFLYSIYLYFRLDVDSAVGTLVYFGYSLVISIGFFLLAGTVGLISCFIFVRRIYAAIHQD